MLTHTAASTLGLGLIATLAIGCGGDDGGKESSAPETIPQPSQGQLEAAGLDTLPLAPESERIDIEAPTFSNPTEITNTLFPISELQSTIFSGVVEDKPFHTETTLLPETKMIEWSPGQWVEARVSQYFAYIGGRIEEVATDYYAQADDGSVWYLGEDVFDYDENGFNDSSLGSWLAGRDGPPQMIMPADPQVGDVHRAENIPAIAFEEVEIKQVGKTVPGPPGPVEGAMVARELHDDGTYSDKVFAPGYGEFYTAHGGEVEAMALAVPTDALDEPMPAELEEIFAAAEEAFQAVSSRGWPAASEAQRSAAAAWGAYRSDSQIPPRLGREMERALRNLGAGIDSRRQEDAGNGAIDVSQSALDFQLRYRPQADIDLDRFEVWARQIAVHDAAGDLGGVRGDVATMEWIRDRFADALGAAQLTAIDNSLVVMREALLDGEPATTVKEAARLRSTLAGIGPADPATASAPDLPQGDARVRLDPADFTAEIDNPWSPMAPGDRRVYRVTEPGGAKQRVVATVTNDAQRVANGIEARSVYSEVFEKGERVEDNRAWYAQDRRGNVWYLGERAREFENGKVSTTDGSWEAGVDGAQPGVIMPAEPRVGLAYSQEQARGVAEDHAEVFSLGERAEVPFGRFRDVLLIKESEGLERALLDYKFYVRDVGPVLGVEISAGNGREELLSYSPGR